MLLSSDSPDFTPWNHSKVNGSKRIVKIRNFSEIFLAFLTIFLTQSILSVCYCSRVAQTTGHKRERKVYVMNNFAALILASIGTIVILAVGWYVLLAIAYWKIFEKAGEPGWKALIPFYNTYSQYKFTWNPNMFWIVLVCSLLGGVPVPQKVLYLMLALCSHWLLPSSISLLQTSSQKRLDMA